MMVLKSLATRHAAVTILFADVVGFTAMSQAVDAAEVMNFLNSLYTRFDRLTDKHHVYKVETIGDCYMVAGGLLPERQSDNAFDYNMVDGSLRSVDAIVGTCNANSGAALSNA